MQLNECCDDASIRAVFASAEHQEALFATGYSKPIMCISIGNKHEISDALKCHFMLKAVIPEINEFAEGLDVLGILDYRLYPKDPGHYERFVCRCASSSNSWYVIMCKDYIHVIGTFVASYSYDEETV